MKPSLTHVIFVAFLSLAVAFQPVMMRSTTSRSRLALNSSDNEIDRRRMILQSIISTATCISFPMASHAIDKSLLDTQAKRFKSVPAFALVNDEGVPFMILRNSGIAAGYFFTTLEGASMVLEDARRDAKDKDLETEKNWNDAKITSVSMEFALKLSKGNPLAAAQNGIKYQTVYDIIPSITALDNTGSIDSSSLWKEQGRVPLFYMDEFELPPEVDGGQNRIPVFLEMADLLAAYEKKYPSSNVPKVKVVELVDTFSYLVGGGSSMKVNTKVAENFVVIANKDQKAKAVDLARNRDTSVPAYQLGKMTAVGGKE